MGNKYFLQALSNFTNDAASGGAIRHLADLGYTVKEISEELDFPTPVGRIRETVWKHFLENGTIVVDDPQKEELHETISYVKEYGSFGKVSFRKVVKKQEKIKRQYIACDFGKQLYEDGAEFEKKLALLEAKDRDYIEGLPWPREIVYHVADERMKRIKKKLGE